MPGSVALVFRVRPYRAEFPVLPYPPATTTTIHFLSTYPCFFNAVSLFADSTPAKGARMADSGGCATATVPAHHYFLSHSLYFIILESGSCPALSSILFLTVKQRLLSKRLRQGRIPMGVGPGARVFRKGIVWSEEPSPRSSGNGGKMCAWRVSAHWLALSELQL
ncbi:hypothetical protein SKAU_G00266670 [Synaphobranchus kaupii]|uniref:Uncharacterized protein n=1 Tax=Synaphobranchus kaupii TaxID=118154 RepID=A0A9Q1EZH7_SYNKA|nr:hypothetical protein SKAU_G00266670 [Synaphobranchus kaupii]